LQKHRVCGFKVNISGYLLNSPIITYLPYKYEEDWIKTHEIRAKYFSLYFVFSIHCTKFSGLTMNDTIEHENLFKFATFEIKKIMITLPDCM